MGKTDATFEIEEFSFQFNIDKVSMLICCMILGASLLLVAIAASQKTEARILKESKDRYIAGLEERIEKLEARPLTVFNNNISGKNPSIFTSPVEFSITEDVERIRFD